MTADERLEALLNRAGQTISDLPKKYTVRQMMTAMTELGNSEMGSVESYILHLTDIIDRMEWALENVCGERDWMKGIFEELSGCPACAHWKGRECEFDDDACCPDAHALYEYSGVPEKWRVDDGE